MHLSITVYAGEKKTITNQYDSKQKHNKLKSSLSALFIIKKCPALCWHPAPFKF